MGREKKFRIPGTSYKTEERRPDGRVEPMKLKDDTGDGKGIDHVPGSSTLVSEKRKEDD